ncbi:MAG: hemagglutinin repeat-containing protein [Burkholderiaceae bacterium]|nr:hemagglutinin repeat-containing protein [Burkholderiaceae bacterium]
MNKNLFRIIFNAKRGQRMAVAETATGQGKGQCDTREGRAKTKGAMLATALTAALAACAFAAIALFSSAQAQIVADPSAPGSQRPTVLAAPNGVPLVNITTPSAAGVSLNKVIQFDVHGNGAILNNSRTNVQTQLGGWVQANPWLAAGSASKIVNQVNSSNPSYLNGYVEVAGQRAEVIIANPSGIRVNGGGFINADRVTLTTGTPVINGGSLESYRVSGGTVAIEGLGLDTRTASYTDIIARAVEVNAGLWANYLKVTTGSNDVNAANTSATPITGTGAQPNFMLDVAAIGGMYAGHIFIVGTEAGLGTRNAGAIGASAGEAVLLSNGWVSNTGAIQAAGNLQINASGNVTNTGPNAVISAQGNASVTTGGSLTNTASATLAATGTLSATAAGALQNNQSTIAANGAVTMNAASLANESGSIASVASSLTITTTGATSNTIASGATQGGSLGAGGDLSLSNTGLTNTGSSIVGGNVTIGTSQGALNNTAGTISASGTASISSGALTNSAGLIQASSGALGIDTHGQALDNTDGLIVAAQDLSVTSASLANTRGTLKALNGNATLTAGDLNNTAGSVYAGARLTTTATGLTNSGSLYAVGDQTVQVSGAISNTGVIASQGNTAITADSLNSSAASLLAAGVQADGSLAGAGDLNVTTTQALVAKGQNLAAGQAVLSGASLDLSGSQTGAATIALTATAGNINTSAATITTAGSLSITAKAQTAQVLVNTAGNLSAGQINLDVANLNNAQGQIVQSGSGNTTIALTSPTATLDNTQGRIATNGENLVLSAQTLTNTDGKIEHAGTGTLRINAATLNDQRGQITSNGALELIAGNVNHDDASTLARQVTITASTVSNRAGQIIQTGTGSTDLMAIAATGSLDNTDGTIAGNGSAIITAPVLTNTRGKITAVKNADITATTRLDNTDGLLAAGQRLGVAGGTVDNLNTGSLEAGTVSVTTTQNLTNSGKLIATDQLDLMTTGTLNNSGQIAGQQTTVQAATINNQTSGRIEGNTLTVTADTVNNSGGIVGDTVTVNAGTLNNQGANALVAATGQMDLYVRDTLNNTGGANVYSLGDLNIAANSTRDGAGTLLNRTTLVNNSTSLLQADGNMQIAAQTLLNTRAAPQITSTTSTTTLTLAKRADYWMCENGNYVDSFAGYCAAGYASLAWYDPAIHINPNGEKPSMWIGGQAVETDRVTTTTATTEQLQGTLQTEPKVLVGNNLILRNVGNLRNEYGSILAGGDATIGNADPSGSYQTASVSNFGAVLSRNTVVDEYSIFRWNRNYGSATNVSVAPQASTTVVGRVGGTLSAGGTFSIYAGSVVNTNALPGQSGLSGAATPGPAGSAFVLPSLSSLVAATGGVGSISSGAALGAAGALSLSGQGIQAVQLPGSARLLGMLTLPVPRNPGQNYLVESDSRFTNFKTWLSSDYLLSALSYNPTTTQKRLGDGFFEQKLIREQVAELTGKRFLADYRSDEAQYQALMSSGATVAQAWNLRPGIALTAEQVARLTSDMVWLVEQDVAFTDGTTTKALVPVVYLSQVHAADLQPTGALISAKSLNITAQGDVTNNGALQAQTSLLLAAGKVTNELGRIDTAQGATRVLSSTDIINRSGTISGGSVQLDAARDIQIETLTRQFTSSRQTVAGQVTGSGTEVGPQAGIVSRGDLLVNAQRDIALAGALLSARGDAGIQAGGNLTIGTVQTRQGTLDSGNSGVRQTQGTTNLASTVQTGGNLSLGSGGDTTLKAAQLSAGNDLSVVSRGNLTITAAKDSAQLDENLRAKNYVRIDHTAEERVVGSNLNAQGNVSLSAGQTGSPKSNITIEGSSVSAGAGALNVAATGDVSIVEARQKSEFDLYNQTSKKGFLSSKSSTERNTGTADVAIGSSLSGNTVNITAGNNLAVRGSSVVSDEQTTLAAKNNVTLEAAQNTYASSSFKQEKKSGLFSSGGLSVTLGKQQQSTDTQSTSTTAAASTVGSIGGNVTIQAGESYKQVGSDVLAPGGDISIIAKKVDIVEARETSQTVTEQKFKQSGISAGISSPIISAIQGAQSMAQAASDTSDGRVQALAAAATALNLYNNAKPIGDAATALTSGNPADAASLSISLGSSKSQSTSTSQSDTARGSSVKAGGNIAIAATGAGQDSNLTIQGSAVEAGKSTLLFADNQVNILAARNTSSQNSSNSSSSASIGVSFGAQTGVTVSASKGAGQGNGSDTSYTNSRVTGGSDAGNTVSLISGGDTNLKGAVVAANTVKADVGGNLNIESLQDTSSYASSQKSAGGSITIGPVMGGSVSASKSSVNSNFQSVAEQSGIKAGDGGFQVDVKGNTDLKGGVIASTDKAVNEGNNSFTTGGTLTTSDIQNTASYSGKAVGISIDSGQQAGKFGVSGVGVGIGSDKGEASSTSTSGISGIAGNTAVRSTDAETGIKPIFDADKVQREINAQVAITQAFGRDASKAIGDYAESKMKEANALRTQAQNEPDKDKAAQLSAEAKVLEDNWGEKGTLRLFAHTAVGGLTGGTGGALGAAAGTLTAPSVAQALRDAGIDGPLASTLTALASTAVGATLGGTAGAGAALNEAANNYLSHQQWSEFSRKLASCKTDAECQQIKREYAELSQKQDALLATCDARGDCLVHMNAVKSGADKRIDLIRVGELPIAYAGAYDLQFMGQKLAVDPAFRQQVGQSVNYMAWCSQNASACNTDQMKKAMGMSTLVLGPFIAANPGLVYAVLAAQQGQRATSAVIGGTVNAGAQLAIGGLDNISGVDVMLAAATAYATSGMGMAGTVTINTGGAAAGEVLKGKDILGKDAEAAASAMMLTALGSVVGFKVGELTKDFFDPMFNSFSRQLAMIPKSVYLVPGQPPITVYGGLGISSVPSTAANISGSFVQEFVNLINSTVTKDPKK